MSRLCKLVKGAFGRWVLVNPHYPDMAWSGSRWVPHDRGLPMANVQICNFSDDNEAKKYASENGLEIAE